jgi:epoxyqueuosine reductase
MKNWSDGVVERPIDSLVVTKAKSLGFAAVGFTKPGRPAHFDRFTAWLRQEKNADMSWLTRNLDIREDPSKMLEGCKTIISLAYPYSFRKPETADGFSVARYAAPLEEDYHFRLKRLCREISAIIDEGYSDSRSRVCVDSAPLLERSIALVAGLGFMGKNNLIIVPGYGSYVYLAEILTTAPIPFSPVEPLPNQCGLCSHCLDACPKSALEKPFTLDASKCLSYLTVEHKEDQQPDLDLSRAMGKCFFGCDRCQEVCPFNREKPQPEVVLPSTDEFLNMREKAFQERFGKTALARGGLENLKKNIQAASGRGTRPTAPNSPFRSESRTRASNDS